MSLKAHGKVKNEFCRGLKGLSNHSVGVTFRDEVSWMWDNLHGAFVRISHIICSSKMFVSDSIVNSTIETMFLMLN